MLSCFRFEGMQGTGKEIKQVVWLLRPSLEIILQIDEWKDDLVAQGQQFALNTMVQLIKFFHFILVILTADPKGTAETTNSETVRNSSRNL